MEHGRGSQDDPELFTAFYCRWRAFAKREAVLVCQNDADAEDWVQSVFMHLWESRSWPTIRHPRAYFQGVARRAASTIKAGFEPLPDESDVADPSKGPLQLAVAGEARTVMLEALDALPTRCRRVMKLTLLEGYSASEIAAECGVGHKAVVKQRRRGRRRLVAWFEARGGPPVWLSTFEDGGG